MLLRTWDRSEPRDLLESDATTGESLFAHELAGTEDLNEPLSVRRAECPTAVRADLAALSHASIPAMRAYLEWFAIRVQNPNLSELERRTIQNRIDQLQLAVAYAERPENREFEEERERRIARLALKLMEFKEMSEEWRKFHFSKPNRSEKVLFALMTFKLQLISFFSGAPDVPSVSRGVQERSWLALMGLKIRNLFGGSLDFESEKRLKLSLATTFLKNVRSGHEVELGVDRGLVPLTNAVNSNPHLAVYSSNNDPCCSGHLYVNPGNYNECFFMDTGSITILVRKTALLNRIANVEEELADLIERWNTEAPECAFTFLKFDHPLSGVKFWDFKWNLDCSLADDNRALLRKLFNEDLDPEELISVQKQLFAIGREVRRRGIIEKYEAFLKEVALVVGKI